MNKNTKSPVCLRTIKVNHAGKISPVNIKLIKRTIILLCYIYNINII